MTRSSSKSQAKETHCALWAFSGKHQTEKNRSITVRGCVSAVGTGFIWMFCSRRQGTSVRQLKLVLQENNEPKHWSKSPSEWLQTKRRSTHSQVQGITYFLFGLSCPFFMFLSIKHEDTWLVVWYLLKHSLFTLGFPWWSLHIWWPFCAEM